MLPGKVALITGSAKGLGKAFGEALLKRGARVVLSDINEGQLAKTTSEFQQTYGKDAVTSQICDVTDNSKLKNLFDIPSDKFGGLDIVCNNAGILDEKNWKLMVDINLNAMISGTELAIERMGSDGSGKGGLIVNVSSSAGTIDVPFAPIYGACKTGILAYTRNKATYRPIQKQGIRLNCLCPNFADTDILKVNKETAFDLGMAINVLKHMGVMPVSNVTAAFMDIVDNEKLNGGVMFVTVDGHRLVEWRAEEFANMFKK